MTITPIYFFSVVKNVTSYLKTDKDVHIDKLVFPLVYERQKDHIKSYCKSIWNSYENGYFTTKEFKLYILQKNLTHKSFFITNVKVEEIKKMKILFGIIRIPGFI